MRIGIISVYDEILKHTHTDRHKKHSQTETPTISDIQTQSLTYVCDYVHAHNILPTVTNTLTDRNLT